MPALSSHAEWTRRRAVEIHDETAATFSAEYAGESIFDSPFRYGRHLIDRAWDECVSRLPAGANCLDIGCGVGAHMARLLERGFAVKGIEPSAEMRALAATRVPEELLSDGSVLQLSPPDGALDFVYAIEVFRYLSTRDNALGHKEIARVLRPGGIYFGTYVNSWALDGFHQLSQLRKLASRLTGAPLRYHVEFETPWSLTAKLRKAGFSEVVVHGAMWAPLRILHKLSPRIATTASMRTMRHEQWLSNSRPMRPFAAHLIATARS
jgi:ubiquinone/menaquinone biosynthesis C-methylase UbiE